MEQTLSPSAYALDDYSSPNWLLASYGTSWPGIRSLANAVKVRYVVGPTFVAPSIKAAILLLAGDYYANRENAVIGVSVGTLPIGVMNLLQPYRVSLGV